jgi:hypothetical protein
MNWKLVVAMLVCMGCGSVEGEWSLSPRKAVVPAVIVDPQPVPPSPSPPPQPTPIPPVVKTPYVSLPPMLTVKAGGWLPIEADTNCPKVIFETPDDDLNLFPDGQLSDPLKTVVSAIVPGQYRIKAIAAMADVPCMSQWCIITVTGAQPPPPPPPPGPPPGPTPDPTPNPPAPFTTANLWIVTVDDVTVRSPATAKILTDPFWFTLTLPRFQYAKLDLNSTGVKNSYADLLQLNGGQPAIGIFDMKSRVWLNQNAADTKLPATVDGLKTLIRKYGGQL